MDHSEKAASAVLEADPMSAGGRAVAAACDAAAATLVAQGYDASSATADVLSPQRPGFGVPDWAPHLEEATRGDTVDDGVTRMGLDVAVPTAALHAAITAAADLTALLLRGMLCFLERGGVLSVC
jgi:hypothetical protein